MAYHLCLTAMVLAAYLTAVKACPSSCTCDPVWKAVDCSHRKFLSIPDGIPGDTTMLHLEENSFQQVNSSQFSNYTKLQTLYLYNNNISTIEAGAFAELEHLSTLRLFTNHLSTLENGMFQGLTNLSLLDLSRNRILTIPDDVFSSLQNLEVLHLWDNQIIFVSLNAFRGLDNLHHLTLDGNNLTAVPTQSFQTVPKLETLQILNLPVTSLPAYAFKSLPHLKALHIGDWPRLEFLSPEAFDGLDLTYLSLYRCNLQSLPFEGIRRQWGLKQLLLYDNPIANIRPNQFYNMSQLEELYLNDMLLDVLDSDIFKDLTSLIKLDMSSNYFKSIPPTLFRKLRRLEYLDLSFNQLSYLPQQAFQTLHSLRTVRLGENPLQCDCDLKWLKVWEGKFTAKEIVATCSRPLKLHGLELKNLNVSNFICELPYITGYSKDVWAKEGEDVMLECKATGFPQPRISWVTPDGLHLDPDSKYDGKLKVSNEIVLYIQNVTDADEGEYMCLANNKGGSDKVKITLTVGEYPFKPSVLPQVADMQPRVEDHTKVMMSRTQQKRKKANPALVAGVIIAAAVLIGLVFVLVWIVRKAPIDRGLALRGSTSEEMRMLPSRDQTNENVALSFIETIA
ncbi:uncharacterized protein LOC144876732 [Branchiostoma floridae x Branchiostoma japonicum]